MDKEGGCDISCLLSASLHAQLISPLFLGQVKYKGSYQMGWGSADYSRCEQRIRGRFSGREIIDIIQK